MANVPADVDDERDDQLFLDELVKGDEGADDQALLWDLVTEATLQTVVCQPKRKCAKAAKKDSRP
jgi:hypothetical protein